jgi:hypothetical protein
LASFSKHKIGAFFGWKVLLDVDPQKRDGFCRLIRAGGGDVIVAKTNLSPEDFEVVNVACYVHFIFISKISQSFSLAVVDVKRGKQILNNETLLTLKCPSVSPEYIAEYITSDHPPLTELYRIPIKPISQNIQSGKKR